MSLQLHRYTGYDTIIPHGAYNRITQFALAFPVTTSQPTYLAKGLHYNEVVVTANTFSLIWKLGGVSRNATALYPFKCRRI